MHYKKEKHKLVNIFSNFSIFKETSDGKLGNKLNISNDSKKIKTATVSDRSQNANPFPSVREYKLKRPKNIAIRHLNVKAIYSLRSKMTEVKELITNKIDINY